MAVFDNQFFLLDCYLFHRDVYIVVFLCAGV
uniref:Uncharacterized protein n=1 Tax=Anguilla anguilla TaxID=7936 RepID=A0A0E9R8A2_ANGAN